MVQYLGTTNPFAMAYSTNPSLPRIRQEAVRLHRRGWSARKIGRHLGFHHTAVMKWVAKARVWGDVPLPTKSSKPKHHPRQISNELAWQIFHTRLKVKRSAEVIHQILKEEKIAVSLSTVKRTLDRGGLLNKRSPYKRFHPHVDRPLAERPGSLVQLDTIHTMLDFKKRMYTFTLIDVCSRWTHAKTYAKINAATTLRFLAEAQRLAPFHFEMLQTDHGPEFGKWFIERSQKNHRHSRIGKPNDNAHIERFNRTLQEECLDHAERTPEAFNKALKKYLPWYNTERHHFGLGLKKPADILAQVVPRY
jgi:putative transposase